MILPRNFRTRHPLLRRIEQLVIALVIWFIVTIISPAAGNVMLVVIVILVVAREFFHLMKGKKDIGKS